MTDYGSISRELVVLVPYLKSPQGKVYLPWKMGHTVIDHTIIDTGTTGPNIIVNEEVPYELGIPLLLIV